MGPSMSDKPKHGGPRPNSGPKPKPVKGRKLTIYIMPDVEQWLRSQPGTVSETIADLVKIQMKPSQ